MLLWIKRIIITLAMVVAFLCAIVAFGAESKTISFMALNILLLVLPIVNIVLYFIQSAHETQKLSSFARCILFGLECLMCGMGVDAHVIGAIATFITLIPSFISMIKYINMRKDKIMQKIVFVAAILGVLVALVQIFFKITW